MMLIQHRAGFVFTFRHLRGGRVIFEHTEHNLMPYEGVNHMLSVLVAQGTQTPTWYIAIYGNDYAPDVADTAATFPTLAGELVGYTGNRPAFLPGAPSSGVISNAGQEAEFTFTAQQVVRGGFVASHAVKGSTAGVLLSAVQLPSPRTFEIGDVVSVAAGLEISPT